MSDYVGLLLAAGRSLRFGADKLLHPLPDGTPVALASARALLSGVPRVLALVNGDNPELESLLREAGLELVVVSDREEGMGTSLATGVAASTQADGWIVALADMPFIQPETVARVRGALAAGAPLAATYYQGRRGHPVGFSRRFQAELLTLAGDTGARTVLEGHLEDLVRLDCADPGVLLDIDTPQDLDRRFRPDNATLANTSEESGTSCPPFE